MTGRMSLNDRIKAILAFKGMSQRSFANQVGMSESQLSKMLNSRKRPSATDIDNMLRALGIPYDCLMGRVPLFDELLQAVDAGGTSMATVQTYPLLW